MIRIVGAVEHRFVVPGRAVSFRSPNAAAYKAKVRECLPAGLRRQPLRTPFEVRLDCFHSSPRRFDMDNVAKCVLDAMNAVAYTDDQLATLQSAKAHDLRHRVTLSGGPLDLIKPLRRHRDYLVVRIRLTR